VGIPAALAVAMFSLADVPDPRRPALAPDAFEGPRAAALAGQLTESAAEPRPGSDADEALAELVAARFATIEGAEVSEQSFQGSFEGADVELRNVIAVLPGDSERQVALIAHRDVASGSGATTSIASTAALLEIAAGFGGSTHRKTVVFVSTDGGELGALGARRFADDYSDAALLDAAVVLSQPASADPRAPLVIPWSGDPESSSAELVATAGEAVSTEVGLPPGDEGPLDELFRLALPAGIGEQAPLIEGGVDAVRLSSSGELPIEPAADGADDLSATALERFGRAALSLTLALDLAPTPLEHGPDSYIGLAGNLLPGWALELIALALLLPVAFASAAGLVRLSGRPERIMRGLGWALGRVLPFLAALLALYVLALVGLAPSPDFPFDPDRFEIGVGGVIAVVLIAGVLAAVMRVAHPLRPPPPGAVEAAPAATLLLASAGAIGVWLVNPVLALLLAPGLHLWMLAALPEIEPRRGLATGLVALALLPLVAGLVDLAGRLDAGPGVGWDVLLMVSGGHVGAFPALLFCLLGGCALAIVALAGARPSPPAPRIAVFGHPREGGAREDEETEAAGHEGGSGEDQSRRWSKPRGSIEWPPGPRSVTPEPSWTEPISVRRRSDPPTPSAAARRRSGGRDTSSS
jgi:hypothetical protein